MLVMTDILDYCFFAIRASAAATAQAAAAATAAATSAAIDVAGHKDDFYVRWVRTGAHGCRDVARLCASAVSYDVRESEQLALLF